MTCSEISDGFHMHLHTKHTKSLFKRMDQNDDDYVTFDEFYSFLEKDSEEMRLIYEISILSNILKVKRVDYELA